MKHPQSPCDAALEVTRIMVGGLPVGITGLKAAIEEVAALGELSEAEIAQALYERLKPLNYIPPRAAEEYKQAFLREYKKARGEAISEETGAPTITILGPGCPHCHRLEQMVYEILTELSLPAQVEMVTDLKEITARGVFATPALIINGQVRVMGKLPSRDTLKEWLKALAP